MQGCGGLPGRGVPGCSRSVIRLSRRPDCSLRLRVSWRPRRLRHRRAWAVLVLAGRAAVSEKQRVTIGQGHRGVDLAHPNSLAAVLFDRLLGMTVAAVSNLGAFCAPFWVGRLHVLAFDTGALRDSSLVATLAETSSRSRTSVGYRACRNRS